MPRKAKDKLLEVKEDYKHVKINLLAPPNVYKEMLHAMNLLGITYESEYMIAAIQEKNRTLYDSHIEEK